jgi:hypothetical protein
LARNDVSPSINLKRYEFVTRANTLGDAIKYYGGAPQVETIKKLNIKQIQVWVGDDANGSWQILDEVTRVVRPLAPGENLY